jgi:hypothetical protein
MNISIGTWFVADGRENTTHFPQVGGKSWTPKFQAVYWRCVSSFYATSVRQNPNAKHVFYTNVQLPEIDGVSIKELFSKWEVSVVQLPITFRLSPKMATSFGNQFYILDIINYLSEKGNADKYIILDSDCVWNGTVDSMSEAIDKHGCLTYTLGFKEHANNAPINGVTRNQMGDALLHWKPESKSSIADFGIDYHGGEIFAASHKEIIRMHANINDLWQWQIQQMQKEGRIGFLEEAHFLSILYASCGYKSYTANPFIKRMWTSLGHNNLDASDMNLSIWHLPAEKKSGFAALFQNIIADRLPDDHRQLRKLLSRLMGVPRRNTIKFINDFTRKSAEKVAAKFIKKAS